MGFNSAFKGFYVVGKETVLKHRVMEYYYIIEGGKMQKCFIESGVK
jgi:hypothetical protein